MIFRACGCLLLVLLAACDRTPPPVDDAARVDRLLADNAAAVTRLDGLFSIPARLESIPPSAEPRPFGPLTGKARVVDRDNLARNVLYVHVSDLRAGMIRTAPHLLDVFRWEDSRKCVLRVREIRAAGGAYGGLFGGLNGNLPRFSGAEYAVVLRGKWTPPWLHEAKDLQPARYEGDAQVFALSGGVEHLGGFPILATSGDGVDVAGSDAKIVDKALYNLNRGLQQRLLVRLSQQLAALGGVDIPEQHTEPYVAQHGYPR